MELKLLFVSAVLGAMCYSSAQTEGNECIKANAESCSACIQVGAKCGWCTDPGFLKYPIATRCDEVTSLMEKGCSMSMIENPRGSLLIHKNIALTDHKKGWNKYDSITQIQPQEIALHLRSGETQTFTLNFKMAEDHPIDLYYIMDVSDSTKDLENAKNIGISLLMEMSKITSDFRIGFGFVEKKVMPDISTTPDKLQNPCTGDQNCLSSFSFKNVLKLTRNLEQLSTLLGRQQISGNQNSSGGGLGALMQAAVCEEQIGWRNVTRLLLLSTNAGFHFSEDEKLGTMTPPPNDGKCHLEKSTYTTSTYTDHPSVAQLVGKLRDNNLQVIFAVPEELQPAYDKLKNLIPKSAVGALSANSSNVINLISDAYNSRLSAVILENTKLPKGVDITYQSYCKNGVVSDGDDGRKCFNISIGDEVSFNINITANRCPEQCKRQTVKIRPLGISEEVKIKLNFICDCECQKEAVVNSGICNSSGNFECGICRCNEGHIGQKCECLLDEVFSENLEDSCRKDGSSDICSNNGDCVCGTCECKKRDNPLEYYSGRYCECDNFNCDRANNKLCAGHGLCECRVCTCNSGYTGSACDCSLDISTCLASNNQVCNGRGICECGACKCTDPKFQGPTCEICPTCPGVCAIHEACVLCRAFGKGPKKDTCEQECNYFTLIKVKDKINLPQPFDDFPISHCKMRDSEDCWFYYTYAVKNHIEIHAAEKLECPAP